MLGVLLVQGGLLARLQVVVESAQALSGVFWSDSDQRCFAHISEQPHPPADGATEKQRLEPRDPQFASAFLSAVPAPGQLFSSAADCEESRGSYTPAYLEGNWTASRLRPFFRRRLRTSRPHLVAMRNLKPCVRIRRLLRGRYVGLPITKLQKPNKNCRERVKLFQH
jgi:hypothetical protein